MFERGNWLGKQDACARTCDGPQDIKYRGAVYIRHVDERGVTTKYYSRRDGDKDRFLHRDMFQDRARLRKRKDWTIPGGMHIHHMNGDALTNCIKNFDMVTEAEHDAIHAAGILAMLNPDTLGQQYICDTCPRRIKRHTSMPIIHPDDTRQHPRRPREICLKEATPENVRLLEDHGVVWDTRPDRLAGGVACFTTRYVEMADQVRAQFPDMLT